MAIDEFEWQTISQGFPPLPPAGQFSMKSSPCFYVVFHNLIFRMSAFSKSSFSGFDSGDILLSDVSVQCYSYMLICIIFWNEWLYQYLSPVRPSSPASNKAFSNRKQTSGFRKKRQKNKCVSGRDNQSKALIRTACWQIKSSWILTLNQIRNGNLCHGWERSFDQQILKKASTFFYFWHDLLSSSVMFVPAWTAAFKYPSDYFN